MVVRQPGVCGHYLAEKRGEEIRCDGLRTLTGRRSIIGLCRARNSEPTKKNLKRVLDRLIVAHRTMSMHTPPIGWLDNTLCLFRKDFDSLSYISTYCTTMVLYRSRNVRTRSTIIIVGIIFYCISLYVVRVPKYISYSLFYGVFQLLFCTVILFLVVLLCSSSGV